MATKTARRRSLHALNARALNAALLLGVFGVSASPASAQGRLSATAADTSRFTLELAIALALEHAPNIDIARGQLEQARGNLAIAAAAFDLNLRSSMAHGADRSMTFSPAKPDELVAITTSSTKYSVSADRVFRRGFTATPGITIARTAQSTSVVAPPNTATASLTVAVPLLRGRGGGVAVANERAAGVSLRATELDLRQNAAVAVLDVVSAYWSYVAASRRLAVHVQSEERAGQLVALTTALAEADERPKADIAQAEANHAAKRATRIGAEQALLEARQALGLAIGLDAERILALPEAASDFPAATDWPAGELAVEAFQRDALAQRVDLASAAARRASATLLNHAAQADVRRQLDLSMTLGYTGIQRGRQVGNFFSPLYTNVPGLNANVQLGFGFPAHNSAARGRLLQSEASLQQAAITEARVRRTIRTGVTVAAMGVQRSLQALKTAELAVTLSTAAVENEKEKFRHGASTLFEQIQSEDALTSALLGAIAQRERYATALARLRFELGELVRGDGEALSVDVQRLLTPPAAGGR